jgi:hypothetical protein
VIDFRYHLVTIIAIFLALAIGIVVGTTALNGPVLDGLRDRNSALISDKRALQGDVRDLQADVDTADEFARTLGRDLLDGRLAGQRVLIVTTPGADDGLSERLSAALVDAGATVTGRLALQDTLLDPGQRQLVDDVVAQVVPPGVDLPEGSAVERAAAELGASLLTGGTGDPVDRDAARSVVAAFEEAGFVDLADETEDLAPATLAVVLAAPAGEEPDDTGDERIASLLDVITQLDPRSRGTVVGGPTEALLDGGLLRALRGEDTLDAQVSSVDNVDRAVGQVAVVLALREQLDGGVGRYGSGSGAQAPIPTPAPPSAADGE